MDRITRERNSKLHTILYSNVEQRNLECAEASQTLARQEGRVDAIRQHLAEVSKQVMESLQE